MLPDEFYNALGCTRHEQQVRMHVCMARAQPTFTLRKDTALTAPHSETCFLRTCIICNYGSGEQASTAAGSPSREVRDDDFDRDFYLGDDDGGPVDDLSMDESSKFLGDEKKFREREADMARCAHAITVMYLLMKLCYASSRKPDFTYVTEQYIHA